MDHDLRSKRDPSPKQDVREKLLTDCSGMIGGGMLSSTFIVYRAKQEVATG